MWGRILKLCFPMLHFLPDCNTSKVLNGKGVIEFKANLDIRHWINFAHVTTTLC